MKQLDPSISIWHGIRRELADAARRIAQVQRMDERLSRDMVGILYGGAGWEALTHAFDNLVSRDIWQAADMPELEEGEKRDERLMRIEEVQCLNQDPEDWILDYYLFREWFARRSFPPVAGYVVSKEQCEFMVDVWERLQARWDERDATSIWLAFFALPDKALTDFARWREWLEGVYGGDPYPNPLWWQSAHEQAVERMRKSRSCLRSEDLPAWKWLSSQEIYARLGEVHPFIMGKRPGNGFTCLSLTLQVCAQTDARISLSVVEDGEFELRVASVVCPDCCLKGFDRTGIDVNSEVISEDLRREVEKDTFPLTGNRTWVRVW